MRKQNEGVLQYQEDCRQETLSRVDEAYQYLKETHQKITKRAISDTSGLAMRTIHKPYVQQYLLKYPEFNPNIEITNSDNTVREQKLEIARLKKLLAKSKNQNNRLTKELLTLKEKHKELEYNYECLLGDYQKAGEKKIIRL